MINVTLTGNVYDENENLIDCYYDVYYKRQNILVTGLRTELNQYNFNIGSIEHLTQKKVDLMNSHVNGISRPTLNNQSTYNFARFLHGETIVHALGIKYIDPKQVTLKPILVK